MLPAVPRSKTPVHRQDDVDRASVQPNDVDEDLTEPELAPPVRPIPGAPVSPEVARSRKETLISPIPALMAAQMNQEDRGDATPKFIDLRDEVTSKVLTPHHDVVLKDDDSDYVLEFVAPVKLDPGR